MRLYEIDEAILGCIDTETGEVIDPERLTALQMERTEKIEGVALWVKDIKAEIEAVKAEKNAFADRQKSLERKLDSVTEWLKNTLDGQKFSTSKAVVSFRRTESVKVEDVFKLSENYLRYSDPTPDKAAIKKALKAGETVEGAELVESVSMTVK